MSDTRPPEGARWLIPEWKPTGDAELAESNLYPKQPEADFSDVDRLLEESKFKVVVAPEDDPEQVAAFNELTALVEELQETGQTVPTAIGIEGLPEKLATLERLVRHTGGLEDVQNRSCDGPDQVLARISYRDSRVTLGDLAGVRAHFLRFHNSSAKPKTGLSWFFHRLLYELRGAKAEHRTALFSGWRPTHEAQKHGGLNAARRELIYELAKGVKKLMQSDDAHMKASSLEHFLKVIDLGSKHEKATGKTFPEFYEAADHLGWIYRSGVTTIPADPAKARRWFEIAAQGGLANAMKELETLRGEEQYRNLSGDAA